MDIFMQNKGLRFSNEEKRILLDIIVKTSSEEIFENIIESTSKEFISPSSYVIDGGAHVGRHTEHFIMSVGDLGRVYAVEAISALSGNLDKKFSSRKAYTGINKALYHKTNKKLNFHHIINGSGYSGINLRELPEGFTPEIEILNVNSITMDDMVKNETRKCSFIKLDLEGGEYFALKGAKNILNNDRPVVAFEDGRFYATRSYDYECKDLYDYLSSLNYCLISLFAEQLDSFEKWIEWNPWYTFAIPKEKIQYSSIILEKFSYEFIKMINNNILCEKLLYNKKE